LDEPANEVDEVDEILALRHENFASGKSEPRSGGPRREETNLHRTYDAVNAMLLNEFLKEHRKAQEQEARLTKQEETIAQQQRQIEALTTGLQKVSDRLEASKAAPHLVATLEITNRAASSHCL
jgi:hypothetical protein